MDKFIALKDLRLNMEKYVEEIQKGHSFVVIKRSKPVFKISPVNEDGDWEEIVDFTKIKQGGVNVNDLLSSL